MKQLKLLCAIAAGATLAGCSQLNQFVERAASEFENLTTHRTAEEVQWLPADAKAFLTLRGSGIQQFQCTSDKRGRYWEFIAPQADLYDAGGKKIAEQIAEFNFRATDGSRLISKIAKVGKSESANDLKDLLFTTTSIGKQGILSDAAWVIRSDAKGGIPLADCPASQLGTILNVRFSATYTFYRKAAPAKTKTK